MSLADLRKLTTDPQAAPIYTDIDESLRFIQSAIERMDSLIKALLDLSRISARTNPTETVALQTLMGKIVESFRYQLDHQQIRIEVGTLPSVRGDALRLTQVFSNLIDNAIKYMGKSSQRAIEIGVRHDNGTPTFFVKDTGPGIPAESQETVFRLFRRLGDAVPGEGLGLTAVRKIVQKHGGRIWVESAAGEGSTFCFTLPASTHTDVDSPQLQ
jgi:signal transduction histidine kinase